MSNANLYAVLQGGFPADRSKVALETPDLQYTWDDIDRATACMANLLASLRLPEGSRVAVQAESRPRRCCCCHAARGPGLPAAEHRLPRGRDRIFPGKRRARRGGVFQQEPRVGPARRRQGRLRPCHTLDDDRSGTLLDVAGGLSQRFETVARREDDLAAILYTSGTTGRRGAMLSHGNLASNARVLHQYWGWRADDVLLHMLPIFHVHGLFVASHGALLAGARMIWLPKLDIEQALRYCRAAR